MDRHALGVVTLLPVFFAAVLAGCVATSTSGSGSGADALSGAAAAGFPAPGSFVALGELKDIHFDFDKIDIRPGDAKILEQNARWMKTNPNYLILIEGHADERGTNEYNLALGERRTKATLSYLLAHGVPASRFTTISYGEERPLCVEHSEQCWAANRRAHFMVKAR